MGFTEPTPSPELLVRSYRTVSPSPVLVTQPSAVCSLWHCPAGRPDSPLASILLCGVPTFLKEFALPAVTQPTHHHLHCAIARTKALKRGSPAGGFGHLFVRMKP